jgi:hypothetical protein
MGIMKPAFFGIGFSMLLALSGCAAGFSEDPGQGTSEEAIKSAEQTAATDALRTRVGEDFAAVPSMKGHEIVVVVDRISGTPDQITISAHIQKLTPDGRTIDLDDLDYAGATGGESRVASPYRANVTATVVKDEAGEWSTLKSGVLGSRAVEAYVSGQSPETAEGYVQQIMNAPMRSVRTKP